MVSKPVSDQSVSGISLILTVCPIIIILGQTKLGHLIVEQLLANWSWMSSFLTMCPIIYLSTPSNEQSLTGLNSVFLLLDWLPYQALRPQSALLFLPIAGGRMVGFIPFTRVLVLCEMQTASSRIWTLVTVSISCNGNHYTTNALLI